jgi:hypothetical protein
LWLRVEPGRTPSVENIPRIRSGKSTLLAGAHQRGGDSALTLMPRRFEDTPLSEFLSGLQPRIGANTKRLFNGDGLVVSYLRNIRTSKETIMKLTATASNPAFAIEQDGWISCSHWGMFPVR